MDFGKILAALRPVGEPFDARPGQYALVPDGYSLEDLERLQDRPRRARGTVTVTETASFIAYFNAFKSKASRIFADRDAPAVTGILDYHDGPEAPAWGEHRVVYRPPLSEEWTAWRGADGKKMSQADFALFLEENGCDVRQPDAATLLEVARKLSATKKVAFTSGQHLADGSVQFTYHEEADATAGAKRSLKVPEEFVIGVPVFFNGAPYAVTAKLRYRIKEGLLVMWYDLHRARHVELDAFAGVVETIAKGAERGFLYGAAG